MVKLRIKHKKMYDFSKPEDEKKHVNRNDHQKHKAPKTIQIMFQLCKCGYFEREGYSPCCNLEKNTQAEREKALKNTIKLLKNGEIIDKNKYGEKNISFRGIKGTEFEGCHFVYNIDNMQLVTDIKNRGNYDYSPFGTEDHFYLDIAPWLEVGNGGRKEDPEDYYMSDLKLSKLLQDADYYNTRKKFIYTNSRLKMVAKLEKIGNTYTSLMKSLESFDPEMSSESIFSKPTEHRLKNFEETIIGNASKEIVNKYNKWKKTINFTHDNFEKIISAAINKHVKDTLFELDTEISDYGVDVSRAKTISEKLTIPICFFEGKTFHDRKNFTIQLTINSTEELDKYQFIHELNKYSAKIDNLFKKGIVVNEYGDKLVCKNEKDEVYAEKDTVTLANIWCNVEYEFGQKTLDLQKKILNGRQNATESLNIGERFNMTEAEYAAKKKRMLKVLSNEALERYANRNSDKMVQAYGSQWQNFLGFADMVTTGELSEGLESYLGKVECDVLEKMTSKESISNAMYNQCKVDAGTDLAADSVKVEKYEKIKINCHFGGEALYELERMDGCSSETIKRQWLYFRDKVVAKMNEKADKFGYSFETFGPNYYNDNWYKGFAVYPVATHRVTQLEAAISSSTNLKKFLKANLKQAQGTEEFIDRIISAKKNRKYDSTTVYSEQSEEQFIKVKPIKMMNGSAYSSISNPTAYNKDINDAIAKLKEAGLENIIKEAKIAADKKGYQPIASLKELQEIKGTNRNTQERTADRSAAGRFWLGDGSQSFVVVDGQLLGILMQDNTVNTQNKTGGFIRRCTAYYKEKNGNKIQTAVLARWKYWDANGRTIQGRVDHK